MPTASYIVRVGRRLLRWAFVWCESTCEGPAAGFGLARGIYHAGRSDDLREVVKWLAPPRPRVADRPGRIFPGCATWS